MLKLLKHNQIAAAAQIVQQGGVLIYPTDTVWGFGCDALNATAVTQLRHLKQKPDASPLIWLLPSIKTVTQYCGTLHPLERQLLKKKHTTVVVNGQAVRVIKSGWLNKLVTACHGPLVSTSANWHGQPTITSWRQAVTQFGDQVAAIIRGRKLRAKCPSAVVQVVAGQIKIIRAGHGICMK